MSWEDDGEFVPPAYFTVPLASADRQPLSSTATGVWGELDLTGELLSPLHVGSGAPEIVGSDLVAGLVLAPASGMESGMRPVVEAERVLQLQGWEPVIPGSSMKGALRAVFEALTASCDLSVDRKSKDPEDQAFKPCEVPERPKETPLSACPACSVFGLAGVRARLAVSDFSVEGQLGTVRIPQRYSPPHAPRHGRRLYELKPEESLAGAEETLLVIESGGVLRGSLSLQGAIPWLVGALALAAGLTPCGLPLLRLGGGKNRGMGVVRLRLTGGAYADSQGAWLRGDRRPVDGQVLANWAAVARDQDAFRDDELAHVRERYSHADA